MKQYAKVSKNLFDSYVKQKKEGLFVENFQPEMANFFNYELCWAASLLNYIYKELVRILVSKKIEVEILKNKNQKMLYRKTVGDREIILVNTENIYKKTTAFIYFLEDLSVPSQFYPEGIEIDRVLINKDLVEEIYNEVRASRSVTAREEEEKWLELEYDGHLTKKEKLNYTNFASNRREVCDEVCGEIFLLMDSVKDYTNNLILTRANRTKVNSYISAIVKSCEKINKTLGKDYAKFDNCGAVPQNTNDIVDDIINNFTEIEDFEIPEYFLTDTVYVKYVKRE